MLARPQFFTSCKYPNIALSESFFFYAVTVHLSIYSSDCCNLFLCHPKSHAFFSCLILCSSMNEVVHTSPTIGSNVEEIVVNNTHFLMWDIGGQESLRSSWNTYYTNTEVMAGYVGLLPKKTFFLLAFHYNKWKFKFLHNCYMWLSIKRG